MTDTEGRPLKRLLNTTWVLIIANIVVILGAVWWAATLDHRVTVLEKDEIEIKERLIDETDWKYNDYFTRYLWAERWKQPLPDPPYNTRGGGVPNI